MTMTPVFFHTTEDIDIYLGELEKTLNEMKKSVFSFSEIDYLRHRISFYTPKPIKSIINTSIKETKPLLYHSAKWVCSFFVEDIPMREPIPEGERSLDCYTTETTP
jgi:hypothetical protein